MAEKSGRDWTQPMEQYAQAASGWLREKGIDGYILKKDSPSCGMQKVKMYDESGMPQRTGVGAFARTLMKALPLLPVEEDGRLNDPKIRENFIERVFAYHRWKCLMSETLTRKALIEFHASHKFLILAHSERHLRKLGRLTADLKGRSIRAVAETYGTFFMEALACQASRRQHVNVLQHLAGFLSDDLDGSERRELLETIQDYRKELTPLIVPLTLIRHYVAKFSITYLKGQTYLEPSPKELMIRNHV